MDDFETLVANLPIGVAVLQNDKIIYVNTYLLMMTGYSYSDVENKSVLNFLHPDDKELFIKRLEKRKRGEPLRSEAVYRILQKNGSIVLIKVETKDFKIQDEDFLLLVVKNIGSSMLIYQPLEITSSLIDSLAFNNSFGIWIDDLNDNTIFVNQFLCDVLEVTPVEVMNHKITDFLHPDSKNVYKKILEERKENVQTSSYELSLVNKEGKIFHFRVIGSVLFDLEGNKIASVGLFFNIDEIKKSSEVLSLLTEMALSQEIQSENFWKNALIRLLSIFNFDFGLIYFEGEILTSIPEKINLDFFYDNFHEIIRTRETSLISHIATEVFGRKCESLYYTLIPVREMSSGFLLLGSLKTHMFDDTTKRLVDFFSSQVGLLYENRRKSLEKAEERSFTSLLLDILSHDFVNANTSVFGYLELMREFLEKKQYDKIEEYLERSIELLERSERIIESIQQLTKLRAFDQPKERIDLKKHIESAIETQKVLLLPRKLNVKLECPLETKFFGNSLIKEAFEKIFKLITYFNSNEEVKIKIKCYYIKLEQKNYVKCEITDNSEGIPKEMHFTLLQNLTRGDSRLKSEIGLCLYIANLIIKSLSGKLNLKQLEEDGKSIGTMYEIYLPS
ncbi:MAG: PAS domain S-box protein [Candidatus Heimdallarchaeaceae archaeon]